MAQQFYSPMPENKGAALFVTVRPDNGNVIFTMVKQTSYDPDAKKGGFAGGKRINVNLSLDEVGALIDAVRNKGEVSIFHTFNDTPTARGKFNYYEFAAQGNNKPKRGYGLKITKDEVEFKVGFTPGSAERLAQYLEFALTEVFKVDVSLDYKKEAEFQARIRNNPRPKPAPTPEPEPEAEQPGDIESSSNEDLEW